MRSFISFMLLASAAASPAFAAPGDRVDRAAREQARAERQQARDSRADSTDASRPERAARVERAERAIEPRARTAEAPASAGAVGRPDVRDLQALRDTRRQAPVAVRDQRADQRRQMTAPSTERQRASVFRDRIEQRRQEAQERLAAARQPRPPVSATPRPGTQPPPPAVQRRTPVVQWNSNWRDNSRYDWNNYRHRHRSLFNLGFYFDPFGWGYQRYNIGWRMWPSYYGSQYWLNDPWQYRLPYAPPGYRWVRYWDDAVLVDTWSGQVVDVIYNFFW